MQTQQRIAAATSRAPGPATSLLLAPSLLDAIGPVEGEHVVIIGAGELDLMCSLIARGVAETVLLPQGVRPEPHAADLVVVTRVETAELARTAIVHASRALNGAGRVVIQAAVEVADIAARMLRTSGFSAVVTRAAAGAVLLTAELPLFGKPARA